MNVPATRRLHLPETQRSVMLAPLVGAVAGIGALGFHFLSDLITKYGLTELTGYDQGGPGRVPDPGEVVPWLLILLPALGGLISGALVYLVAPEAEGHGTDAAIDAYHNKRGLIRARVPLVKMVTSAITLGTGGSGGREGPIAQIGAGFGSFLATWLKLSDTDRRILMASGLGAGIGAIFHAPLAGAIFAIEVLYRDPDFEAEALVPGFIATAVSYCIYSLAMLSFAPNAAFQPLFHIPAGVTFNQPWLLLPLAAMAAVMAAASLVYIRGFYGIQHLFTRIPIPRALKPMVGAAATGAVAIGCYYGFRAYYGDDAAHDSLSVLSFGYGFLQKVLDPGGAALLIPVLLVVAFGKILTTALTIGSGGSGGVFGPSMVIGGALGAVVGLLWKQWLPQLVSDQDVVMFAILGMASFFAAAANTPVSTLIMVSELTGSYDLLLPSMWVCALAYLLNRNHSLYQEQVPSRKDSPAHRGDFIVDVLEGMTIRNALSSAARPFQRVPADMTLKQMGQLITGTEQTSFPVIDEENRYRGLFGLNDIRQFLYDSSHLAELAVAEDLAAQTDPLTMTMDLSSTIDRFAESRFDELPVVDAADPERVVAMLRRQDVIAAYSAKLLAMKKS